MGVSPFLCGWTDRTPWKGMLSGSASAGGGLASRAPEFC